VNTVLWSTAIMHLKTDVNLLQRVQNHRLDEFDTDAFAYNEEREGKQRIKDLVEAESSSTVTVSLAVNESTASIAHKVLDAYLVDRPNNIISDEARTLIEEYIANNLLNLQIPANSYSYTVDVRDIETSIENARLMR
jgi:hypothetical protein